MIETSTSYGGAMKGGNLLHEVRASLYDCPQRPLTTSFMAGLGGEMVPLKEFYCMAEIMAKTIEGGQDEEERVLGQPRVRRPSGRIA